ncbi:phenylacetic acid degradation operon negative regulatory protein PaaX [Peribacillus simplex]|uniref:Phenylacetic acid degradation operon negative regulatory protein PaaX n=1 Tax=Peribacillus simplex TaxID=1478 RepID=A0A9X9ETB2_9BACI|nr:MULTISPECIES: phenylacetic acid degradation operon negative regulatory protein PaaX [Bacillaceae]MBT2602176.1 phenylacetic acid degradation operon negative regulatory protein PaaX [Bacillus sp. ISL-53]MCT4476296.1 phenylacetic acid degradation operon negative regulatory protein PaaX [Peribacillus frigoritolerans]PCD06624.1 phenylacetic acid degradation operon negative regulatory protein PaaX [Peribacillus simplex]PKF87989.1 phenylacetic acid degradation operon negative regulatory protein Paa
MGTNTQSMIFTIYGDYIRNYGSKIWIGSLIRLLKEFGHNEQGVRVAVSRMVKQGWIQSEKQGNKSYYFLTDRGVQRMDEAANRIYKMKPNEWDGKWRILMYTIPEDKRQLRDDLRKELLWSGFGSFSSGCWISPNDLEKQINRLIEKYDIDEYVDFFISEYKGPKENQSLVEKSWHLEEIENKYEEFIEKYSKQFIVHQSIISRGEMSDADCFVERTNLVHEYRKFLFIDPGLPKELLPSKWNGNHAALLFSQYYQVLAEPASRFFESVFQENNDLCRKDETYDAKDHPLIIK